jgi:1-acyl-sn-glycerol-3-phosphate acyltransferase
MSLLSPNMYVFCRSVMRHTFQLLYPLKIEGLEHMPSRGPVIICPKHQRWEDIPVMGLALPPPLHYIAKVELFRRPLVRKFLQALGGVPVDRQSPRATLSSFRALLPLLKQRAHIVIFPEGTYVQGRVGPGKHRLFKLLLKLQRQNGMGALPFVPVGITYQPLSVGYQVDVKLGPPLTVPAESQARNLAGALMHRIARLSAEGLGKTVNV